MAQIILWSLFIPAWLLIIPLKMERVKHYLSATFFTLVLSSILWQAADALNWWQVKENIFFLSTISAFFYGYLPVTMIYIFYFTYPNPWLFFGANIALDALQAFVVSPLVFERFGMYELVRLNHFGLFIVIFCLAPFAYLYQLWYEKGGKEKQKTR